MEAAFVRNFATFKLMNKMFFFLLLRNVKIHFKPKHSCLKKVKELGRRKFKKVCLMYTIQKKEKEVRAIHKQKVKYRTIKNYKNTIDFDFQNNLSSST